jgi:hypothetical protein
MYWHETVRSLALACEHLDEAKIKLDTIVVEYKKSAENR